MNKLALETLNIVYKNVVDSPEYSTFNNHIDREPSATSLTQYDTGDGTNRWELRGINYPMGILALHLPIDGWIWDSDSSIWHTSDEITAIKFSSGNHIPIELGEYGD